MKKEEIKQIVSLCAPIKKRKGVLVSNQVLSSEEDYLNTFDSGVALYIKGSELTFKDYAADLDALATVIKVPDVEVDVDLDATVLSFKGVRSAVEINLMDTYAMPYPDTPEMTEVGEDFTKVVAAVGKVCVDDPRFQCIYFGKKTFAIRNCGMHIAAIDYGIECSVIYSDLTPFLCMKPEGVKVGLKGSQMFLSGTVGELELLFVINTTDNKPPDVEAYNKQVEYTEIPWTDVIAYVKSNKALMDATIAPYFRMEMNDNELVLSGENKKGSFSQSWPIEYEGNVSVYMSLAQFLNARTDAPSINIDGKFIFLENSTHKSIYAGISHV